MNYRTRPHCKLIVQGQVIDDREPGFRLKLTAEVDEHLRLGRLIPVNDKPTRKREKKGGNA